MTSMQGAMVQPKSRQQDLPDTVAGYFDLLLKNFEKAQHPGRVARYYTWAKAEFYFRGQQLIYWNPETRRIEELDEEEADDELYFINNIMLPFIENIAAEYGKSRPRFAAYCETGDNAKIRAAIDAAQYLMSHWSDTLWSPEDLQRESKMVQLRSRVYTLTEWDQFAGPLIDVPKFEQTMAQLPFDIQNQYMAAVSMMKQRAGAIRSRAIDPLKVSTYDRYYNPETTPWLKYEDWELDARLLKTYQHLDRLPAKKALDMMSGLYFLRQLETAIGNTGEGNAFAGLYGCSGFTGDLAGATDEISSVHTQEWLESYMYDEYVTTKEENLYGSGFIIPAGVKLGEVFPDDARICKVNGQPVMAYNDAKNDAWGGYLFTVSAAGHNGVGSENLMSQQDWFCETGSLIMTSGMFSSNGITVADANRVRDGQVINKPGTVVGIEDMMPGDRLEDVIKHITTSGLDPALMSLPEFLKESMQLTSGARSSQVSGLPGQGINTATGVQNMAATADSAAAMKLELRAHNQARRMEQGLKKWQRHQTYPRYFGRFSETGGRYLRGLDIPYELGVRYEPDSHEPRTNFDRRQDFGALVGLGIGQGKLPPAMERQGVRLFGSDLNLNEMDKWEVIGQLRLDKMEEALGLAGQMMRARGVDEVKGAPYVLRELLIAAAPDPLDNHAALAEFYRDFYASDAYRNSSPVMQAAIHQLVALHEAGGVIKAREEVAKQVAATAPARDADEQANAAQGEREDAAQQNAAEQQSADRDHQAGEADRQRAHDREMQESKQRHELDLARLNQKEKPTE